MDLTTTPTPTVAHTTTMAPAAQVTNHPAAPSTRLDMALDPARARTRARLGSRWAQAREFRSGRVLCHALGRESVIARID